MIYSKKVDTMERKNINTITVILGVTVFFAAIGWLISEGGLGNRLSPTHRKVQQIAQNTNSETMSAHTQNQRGVREAMFYEKLQGRTVRCELCFRYCVITDGRQGLCRVRENRRGVLYTLVYGVPSAVHIDPIEKEPQYHHLPGSNILCIGTVGCNFFCLHCHNWHLSQASVGDLPMYDFPPQKVIEFALANRVPIISFTYNDPIVCFEYLYSVAKLAQANGIRMIWHTNGALNHEPLMAILPYTDAVTVDLKGFTDEAYANSSATLQPVLNTLKTIRQQGVWLEIVNLVIPTINDNPQEIRQMSRWIVDNLGPNVPVHFSRFFPNYRLTDISPTPIRTLELAREIAKSEGVRFSTLGNVPGHRYNSTFCPECDSRLIHRVGFTIVSNRIADSSCPDCGEKIPGLWH